MSDRPLDGTVALITGASSGIGAATARRLAHDGATVALVARRLDRMEQVAGHIARLGGHAVSLEADITRSDRAQRVVEEVLDRFGRLDILVNNAGIMLLSTALQANVGDWDRMISLNVQALLHVTHAAIPYLIDAAATSPRQVSDLVNVSSTAGRVARPGSSVYTLTKSGLIGFSESIRQELIGEKVRVGVVEPGTVRTELLDHLDGDGRDAALRQIGEIEPLRADDVADAIGYIVTRERRVAVNEMLLRSGGQTW